MYRRLEALRDTFTLGMLVGDADLCASVYATDGLIVPPGGQARRGPDEIRAYWQQVIDSGGRGDSVTCESIGIRHHVVVEQGVYARFPHPVALGPPLARGSYLTIIEPQLNGTWAWTTNLWTDSVDVDDSMRGRAMESPTPVRSWESSDGAAAVEARVVPGGHVLALHGEFDCGTLPLVRDALIHACGEPAGNLTVDIHGVEYCGADLLGLLAASAARLRAQGFCLCVGGANRSHARLLHLCGLDDLLGRCR